MLCPQSLSAVLILKCYHRSLNKTTWTWGMRGFAGVKGIIPVARNAYHLETPYYHLETRYHTRTSCIPGI